MAELGTGKSKVALDHACGLFAQGEIDRVLVVAGAGSIADWPDKHVPENVSPDLPARVHLWRGGRSRREQRALHDLNRGPGGELLVLAMGVESIGASTLARATARAFVQGGRTFLICDESTKIKNEDAARTREMIALGERAVVRWAMTGRAVVEDPLDLWGQMRFLGLGATLGANWYAYRARYCVLQAIEVPQRGLGMPRKRVHKIVGYRDLEVLRRRLEPHSFRVLKSECLDLPPKTYQRMVVPLSDEQRTAYAAMRDIALVELEDGVFASATHAMTRMQRLHGIVLGYLRDEAGVLHSLSHHRLEALGDVIEEAGGKVAVWCAYQEDVRRVLAYLRERWPERVAVDYYGPTTPEARRKNLAEFQDGAASFFVATAATGGYGLTLTSCNTVVYYSNTWSLDHRAQSEDRFHRLGQTRAVTYVDLTSPGTVETKLIRALREKRRVSDLVMGDAVREWLEWSEEA